jgi:hypothetical protein
MTRIYNSALIPLIGKDEKVDQNDYGASVAYPKQQSNAPSGEILQALFLTREDGAGAVLTPAGKLVFFSADPVLAAGDVALSTADKWETVVGIIQVEVADWLEDAKGAGACINTQPIAFEGGFENLYIAWFHEDATSFNDVAGDDEELNVILSQRAEN